jgi:arylsulfatase
VGIDLGTPVVEAVGAEAKSRFNGKIPKLTVAVRDASAKADAEVQEGWKRVAAQTE